jgi:signal peptidase I
MVVAVLVAALALTALVQALAVQSYVVPPAAAPPTVEPGDRLLVWKLGSPDPGDLVVVDTSATAARDRTTPVDDGIVGRVLSAVASALGLDIGAQDRLAVVEGVSGAPGGDVELAAPVRRRVAGDDVVGTAVLRVWPLDRLGAVTGAP